MTPIYFKQNGSWNALRDVHVKPAGTWRNATQAYVKVSGTWRETLYSDFSLHADNSSPSGMDLYGDTLYVLDSTSSTSSAPEVFTYDLFGNHTGSFTFDPDNLFHQSGTGNNRYPTDITTDGSNIFLGVVQHGFLNRSIYESDMDGTDLSYWRSAITPLRELANDGTLIYQGSGRKFSDLPPVIRKINISTKAYVGSNVINNSNFHFDGYATKALAVYNNHLYFVLYRSFNQSQIYKEPLASFADDDMISDPEHLKTLYFTVRGFCGVDDRFYVLDASSVRIYDTSFNHIG